MCVSLALLGGLVAGGSAVMGLSGDLRSQAPELSAMVVAIGAGAVMVAGYWLGMVPAKELVPSVCGVACVAMVALMLVRFRTCSHGAHHAPR